MQRSQRMAKEGALGYQAEMSGFGWHLHGGGAQAIARALEEMARHHSPRALPGGNRVLATDCT